MKWMSRQLTLPIVVTFSLTGVSLALLYLVYKKEQEVKAARERKLRKNEEQEKKVKVPRQLVPAIIGRGGSTMQDIQIKTGTKLHFDKDDLECANRTCIIKGKEEGVQLAEEMINSIITNQPIIETYEFYIPQKACGRVIGRCGDNLHDIQMQSGAMIIIDSTLISHDPNSEKRVIIKGTAEQIANALSQIEDKVREDKEERMRIEASSASRLPRGRLSPRSTAVTSTESTTSADSLPSQFTSGTMEVYVSAMETPSQFWVQVVGAGTTALDKLVSEMSEYYNNEENREIHVLKNISLGQIVAAKFSFDKQWYRAEVIGTLEDGNCEVYFLDYGDREMVEASDVFELRTDFLSLRLQAVECSLANVKARDNEWSNEACDKFADLTSLAQWKVLTAKVRGYKERVLGCGRSRREGSPIPCVELYDKADNRDVNVALELVKDGFAEAEEALSSAASSTLSLSTRSSDFVAASNIVPPSTPQTERVATSNKSNVFPKTPQNTPERLEKEEVDLSTSTRSNIEEIDLTSPKKEIEEVDLVTPVKNESKRFIEGERKAQRENGGGDYSRNGNTVQYMSSINGGRKIVGNLPPADYESETDDFELG